MVSNPQPRPYVPLPLRDQVMTSLHAMDHLGWKSSVKRVANEYYWPTLKNDVKLYVQLCVPCNKTKQNKQSVGLGEFKVPDKRFSHVVVDIVGPLPESYGYRFLLTALCRCYAFEGGLII